MMVDLGDPSPYRAALADDHPVVRRGLRSLLESDPSLRVVAEYGDLDGVRRGVRVDHPDVLLLDLTLGQTSALTSIPDLLALRPGLKVVVITMHDDAAFAREALRLGASGYALKDAAADELLLAVRSVLDGRTYLQPDLGAQLAVLDEDAHGLTRRESQVLRLLAAGHTNAEIATHLYVSLRTVESHRGQIRAKLGLHTRADLVRWAQDHRLG